MKPGNGAVSWNSLRPRSNWRLLFMPRGGLLALVLIGCGALVGCFGGSYSPSYFPFYLPPGDVIQTHAKPAGRGYFHNFDPKAVRLELKPDQASNPTRSHQVLIASVYDADGDRRRKRRVEWILDGPGYIVEVDEAGLAAGRGYLIDNKRAVSYTELFERRITRGTKDPSDDFTIMPGQTWCIVSCAVEGQTTVTAYAPAIFNRDKSTVTAKLIWSDSQFQFPAPQISRSGGEVTLNTTLHRYEGQDLPDGLKVRYRILDGAPASLMSRGGSTSFSGTGTQREAEVEADEQGRATVRVIQPMAQPGKTRIAVEVLKPDSQGGTVIDRKETAVEWATPQLRVDTQLPKTITLERDTPITLTVMNTGKTESQPVTLRATLPDGAEYVRASPEPTVLQGSQLTWSLGPLNGGQKMPVTLTVRPFRKGTLSVNALAETPDGLRAEQRAYAGVDQGHLRVMVEVPEVISPEERFTSAVLVTNPGSVPAENVTVWLVSDPGLQLDRTGPNELSLGTLAPGQSRRVEVSVRAGPAGRFNLRATATADGNLRQQAEVVAEVRQAAYTLSISGPERLTLNQDAMLELRLRNIGDATLKAGTRLTLLVPEGLTLRDVTSTNPRQQEWRLDALPPGGQKSLTVPIRGVKLLPRGKVEAKLESGGQPVQASHPVSIVGEPALTLELPDGPTTLNVNQPTLLEVVVRNRGNGPARNVELRLASGPEVQLVRGTGADQQPARRDGGQLKFAPLAELPAGSSAVFQLEVAGLRTGSTRLSAELRAEHLRQPLHEDQPLRVR